ncbi:MAG: hypothetical protein E7218_04325 [Anaerofustis stercorihominis]|nr:hypothetical protein [Anaerofustis stercorihominis]
MRLSEIINQIDSYLNTLSVDEMQKAYELADKAIDSLGGDDLFVFAKYMMEKGEYSYMLRALDKSTSLGCSGAMAMRNDLIITSDENTGTMCIECGTCFGCGMSDLMKMGVTDRCDERGCEYSCLSCPMGNYSVRRLK